MKRAIKILCAAFLLATAHSALAAVRYVDANGANATPPYTNWSTAATNIQDAVDVAVAGDEIVVTNGIYATGGRAAGEHTSNRVVVDKSLNLHRVNGPQSTIIDGGQAGRCVYLTDNARLSGVTLTNGLAGISYVGDNGAGGGVYWPQTYENRSQPSHSIPQV